MLRCWILFLAGLRVATRSIGDGRSSSKSLASFLLAHPHVRVPADSWSSARLRQKAPLMAKGFGAPPAAPANGGAKEKRQAKTEFFPKGEIPGTPEAPPPPKEYDSVNSKAAKDFDNLKNSGAPEYNVLVRELSKSNDPYAWLLVGGMAIPRCNSIEKALSMAIYNNEEDLLKGAYQRYPDLKKRKPPLQYGFRLAAFDDDPIEIADKDGGKPSGNFIENWFSTLDSPFNDGSGWGNPMKR